MKEDTMTAFSDLAVDTVIETPDEQRWMIYEHGKARELDAHCIECAERLSNAPVFKLIAVPIAAADRSAVLDDIRAIERAALGCEGIDKAKIVERSDRIVVATAVGGAARFELERALQKIEKIRLLTTSNLQHEIEDDETVQAVIEVLDGVH